MTIGKWKYLAGLIVFSSVFAVNSGCGGRKAKECPAFHEARMTGGTIDKNKKNRKTRRKRRKVKQGVFGPKMKRR